MNAKLEMALEIEIERVIHQGMRVGGYCPVNDIIKTMRKAYKVKDIKKVLKEKFIEPNTFGDYRTHKYATQEASSNKEIGIIIKSPLKGDRNRNILFIREL